jgi:hypothetical protein
LREAVQLMGALMMTRDPFGGVELTIIPHGEALVIVPVVPSVPVILAPQIKVYDIREVLTLFPDIEHRRLVKLVRTAVVPLSWDYSGADVDWTPYDESSGRLGILRHTLAVYQIPQNQSSVKQFLTWLAKEQHGLPRPAELVRDDNRQAIERLLATLRTTSDPLTRGYCVALLAMLDKPTPEAIALLIELLSTTDASDEEFEFQLCIALEHCGDSATGALPVLESKLAGATDHRRKQRYLRTIAALGPQADPVLRRALDTQDKEQFQDKSPLGNDND